MGKLRHRERKRRPREGRSLAKVTQQVGGEMGGGQTQETGLQNSHPLFVLTQDFFFWGDFAGVTLVNKITQVSGL